MTSWEFDESSKYRLRRVLGHRHGLRVAQAGAIAAVFLVAIAEAPGVLADPLVDLKNEVSALPNITSCGPLRDNAVVAQTADSVLHSTSDWIDHNARAEPINTDPVPELRRLGYTASKGHILQGEGVTEDIAIKYILIAGAALKPDCYTDYGVAMMPNESIGRMLAAVVLAGP